MKNTEATCKKWFDKSYGKAGLSAQRLYPNEELLRFLGREYFSRVEKKDRRKIRILEIGCGSCSNLWMIAKEGFNAYGVDISGKSLEIGRQMLEHWGVDAKLKEASMTKLPYRDNYFDAVVDVFSTYCLCENDFNDCLQEVSRVLKPAGKYFSYTPSINSDAFRNYKPSKKIDEFTLAGIKRRTSPYYGNQYPFRFIGAEHYQACLEKTGFTVSYLETVSRTYRSMDEFFEFAVIVGEKNNEKRVMIDRKQNG